MKISLRRARQEDADNVFAWRNDERTRKYVFDPRPIEYGQHLRWFERIVKSDTSVLLIGESETGPIGVLRFDIERDQAEISIYLVPGFEGKGLRPELLKAGAAWAKENLREVTALTAKVMEANAASKKAFEKAGYRTDHVVYRYPLARE